jgi:transposase InsO family protein
VPNVATAEDRVQRQFDRKGRDQLWVTDITEHPTREGKVYCAVVLDTFSRRVVGWSIDGHQTAALVTNALGMAIEQRRPADGATVIHSDQGTHHEWQRESSYPPPKNPGHTSLKELKARRPSIFILNSPWASCLRSRIGASGVDYSRPLAPPM